MLKWKFPRKCSRTKTTKAKCTYKECLSRGSGRRIRRNVKYETNGFVLPKIGHRMKIIWHTHTHTFGWTLNSTQQARRMKGCLLSWLFINLYILIDFHWICTSSQRPKHWKPLAMAQQNWTLLRLCASVCVHLEWNDFHFISVWIHLVSLNGRRKQGNSTQMRIDLSFCQYIAAAEDECRTWMEWHRETFAHSKFQWSDETCIQVAKWTLNAKKHFCWFDSHEKKSSTTEEPLKLTRHTHTHKWRVCWKEASAMECDRRVDWSKYISDKVESCEIKIKWIKSIWHQ